MGEYCSVFCCTYIGTKFSKFGPTGIQDKGFYEIKAHEFFSKDKDFNWNLFDDNNKDSPLKKYMFKK